MSLEATYGPGMGMLEVDLLGSLVRQKSHRGIRGCGVDRGKDGWDIHLFRRCWTVPVAGKGTTPSLHSADLAQGPPPSRKDRRGGKQPEKGKPGETWPRAGTPNPG